MRTSQRTPAYRSAGPALALAVALVATGCTGGGDDPDVAPAPETTTSPAPSGSIPPTASETPTEPVATIPADCLDLLDPATYDAVFGDTPLNDPAYGLPASGAVEPREPDPGAGPQDVVVAATQLDCAWGDPQADVTGLTARFGQVDPAAVQPFFDSLPADGFTCTDEYEGLLCQRTRQSEQYPVEEGATYFLRDGVAITVLQANFPTDDLLGDLVGTIWR